MFGQRKSLFREAINHILYIILDSCLYNLDWLNEIFTGGQCAKHEAELATSL